MRESNLSQRVENIVSHGERIGARHEETALKILNLFYDRAVPPEYLEDCDCATYTASLQDMVFQHKPACPNHDPRWELALLADHRYQAVMQGIRAAGGRGDNQVDLFSAEARDLQQAIGRKLADVEGVPDRD
jgi:hypothetical protein